MSRSGARGALVTPRALLCAGLSLSIGWGIRGNFGHEYGAMIPGALAALAVAIASRREDWLRRAPYFGLYGALGWGFGGSISYMQVIAYTHSGDLASQLYGFACLGAIGFLWAALGGAGTAFAALAGLERLQALVRPLCWVLGAWTLEVMLLPLLEASLEVRVGARRHEGLLYWFDSDWIPALTALAAILAYDLWDRRLEKAWLLGALAAAGAAAGWAVQAGLDAAGLAGPLGEALSRPQGDTSRFDPEVLLYNWPELFRVHARHLGWALGACAGACLYFARAGRFRSGSSLLLHMALGWLAGFLVLPVLAGARMTPPRGDDWAGILGVFAGSMIYWLRAGLPGVAWTSAACGLIGAAGFSGAAWIKLLLVAPGNPALEVDPVAIASWAHWQSANWHSFLEQTYGLINGVGVAVALAMAARRAPVERDVPGDAPRDAPGWTRGFAILFVVLVIPYLNLEKNVAVWTEAKAVPGVMAAPLAGGPALSASAWFHVAALALALALLFLLRSHRRGRLAIVPASALGKAQLLHAALLATVVVGNFERALIRFSEGRLITEGVIAIHALLLACLVLTVRPPEPALRPGSPAPAPAPDWPRGRSAGRRALLGLAALAALFLVETFTVRAIYGDRHAGHSGLQKRFGPEAQWRVQPLQKGRRHS